MANCPEQLECANFYWKHKIRSHHVRLVEMCEHWKEPNCNLLQGQSCSLEKMTKIRKEHGFGGDKCK